MKEKLIIKNFGPIKDMTFEFRKVNVFIGDQGTGKSTVAKLYSLIKNLIRVPFFNLEDSEKEKDINWQLEQYVKTFGVEGYFNDNTEFEYENSNLNLKYNKRKIEINNLSYSLNIPQFNYIVAERVFVSILSDALYGIIETGAKLPTLFNRFGNKFAKSKKENYKRNYNELIGVDFLHSNGIDFISDKEGKLIPLSDGSSGMQGTIPMLVVYDSIVESISSKRKGSKLDENNLMIIEEPELNLFPETQKKVIDYILGNNFDVPNIVHAANSHLDDFEVDSDYYNKKFKNQLVITTHSPYILTSLNNLMYAYQIGQQHEEEVDKIISEKYWINPNDVSAYMMLPNGTCENIIAEDGLIMAEKVDSVNKKINEEFDKILDIQYAR